MSSVAGPILARQDSVTRSGHPPAPTVRRGGHPGWTAPVTLFDPSPPVRVTVRPHPGPTAIRRPFGPGIGRWPGLDAAHGAGQPVGPTVPRTKGGGARRVEAFVDRPPAVACDQRRLVRRRGAHAIGAVVVCPPSRGLRARTTRRPGEARPQPPPTARARSGPPSVRGSRGCAAGGNSFNTGSVAAADANQAPAERRTVDQLARSIVTVT
jgi:hypothetical protein